MIKMLLFTSYFINLANTNNFRHLWPDTSLNKLRSNERDHVNVYIGLPNNLNLRRTVPKMTISSGVNAPIITRRQTTDDTQEQDNNKDENDEFEWTSPENTDDNITDSTVGSNNVDDSEDEQILNHFNLLKETSANSNESPSDNTSESPIQTNTNQITLQDSSKNITEESDTKEQEKTPIARASPDLPSKYDEIFEGDEEEPAQSMFRNKASIKCLKIGARYCIKSCKKAGKTACKAYSCKRRLRRYFKKTCKEKCKERFQ